MDDSTKPSRRERSGSDVVAPEGRARGTPPARAGGAPEIIVRTQRDRAEILPAAQHRERRGSGAVDPSGRARGMPPARALSARPPRS